MKDIKNLNTNQVFGIKEAEMKNFFSYTGTVVDTNTLDSIKPTDLIDTSLISHPLRAAAIAQYMPDSTIGLTTVAASTAATLRTHTYQFLNEDGTVNVKKVQRVLKKYGKGKGTKKDKYERVFQDALNVYHITNKNNGRVYTLVCITSEDIKMCLDQIMHLSDKCTAKDLINIAADMDFIGRAMQEIGIDSDKDKNKKLGFELSDHIAITNTLSRVYGDKNVYTDNLDEAVNAAYANKPCQYVGGVGLDKMKFLKDAKTDEEIKNAVIVDGMGKFQHLINNTAVNLIDKYMDSIRNQKDSCLAEKVQREIDIANSYEETLDFTGMTQEQIEEAQFINNCKYAYHIMLTNGMILLDCVKSLYSLKLSSEGMQDICNTLRNAYYTIGEDQFGLDAEQSAKILIASSYVTIYGKKFVKSKYAPQFSPLWNVIGREFVYLYEKAAGFETDLSLTVSHCPVDLPVGAKLKFVDGRALINYKDVNGNVSFQKIFVKEDYTGDAIVEEGRIVVDSGKLFEYEKNNNVLFLNNTYKYNENSNEIKQLPELLNTVSKDNRDEEIAVLTATVRNADVFKVMPFQGKSRLIVKNARRYVYQNGIAVSEDTEAPVYTIIADALIGNVNSKIKDALVSSRGCILFTQE